MSAFAEREVSKAIRLRNWKQDQEGRGDEEGLSVWMEALKSCDLVCQALAVFSFVFCQHFSSDSHARQTGNGRNLLT